MSGSCPWIDQLVLKLGFMSREHVMDQVHATGACQGSISVGTCQVVWVHTVPSLRVHDSRRRGNGLPGLDTYVPKCTHLQSHWGTCSGCLFHWIMSVVLVHVSGVKTPVSLRLFDSYFSFLCIYQKWEINCGKKPSHATCKQMN